MEMDFAGREQLIKLALDYFQSDDLAHGYDHALAVEESSFNLLKEPEFGTLSINRSILQSAALLHDIGHSNANSSWSSDRGEHIREGVRIAKDVLSKVVPFIYHPYWIEQVCYLILHHDDTNFIFPISTRGNRVVDPTLPHGDSEDIDSFGQDRSKVEGMLRILKEADSGEGSGSSGARRTLNYSLKRGISPVSEGNPLNAWMWEESALGNIRLAAKRAMLDVYTSVGKRRAREVYLQSERIIREFCSKNGVDYQSEFASQNASKDASTQLLGRLKIGGYMPWDELVRTLRRVPLSGDPRLFPYAASTIGTSIVEINKLSPLSLYYLLPKVNLHRELREHLLAEYRLDILDLAGVVQFEGMARIAPPVVEVYEETTGNLQGEIWGLVDGMHRVILARQLGLTHIRAIIIHRVPKQFPLVPLPLRWEEVTGVQEVPERSQKRIFRFKDGESFPDISSFSDMRPEDVRYFFYRDLSALGSDGIR